MVAPQREPAAVAEATPHLERVRAALADLDPDATIKSAIATMIGLGQKLRVALDLDEPGRPYDDDLLLCDVGQMGAALVQLCAASGIDYDRALVIGVIDCERRSVDRRARMTAAGG